MLVYFIRFRRAQFKMNTVKNEMLSVEDVSTALKISYELFKGEEFIHHLMSLIHTGMALLMWFTFHIDYKKWRAFHSKSKLMRYLNKANSLLYM